MLALPRLWPRQDRHAEADHGGVEPRDHRQESCRLEHDVAGGAGCRTVGCARMLEPRLAKGSMSNEKRGAL
jgi:hypothetical protein